MQRKLGLRQSALVSVIRGEEFDSVFAKSTLVHFTAPGHIDDVLRDFFAHGIGVGRPGELTAGLLNRSVWLKIGTIRHRTDWYHHGDPPVGMKLGDDCDDIDLDITLAKYEIARKFLLQVLDEIISEAGIKGHTAIMADGGVVRLVLAKVSAAPAPCFWMASRHSRVRRRSLRQRIGKWRRSRDSAVRRSLRLFSEPSSTNRLHNAATASTA